MRSCHCDNVTGLEYTPDQCRPCWLFHYHPDYRQHWGGSPLGLPCVHLGASTGERRVCPTCPKGTQLKVFGCQVFGQCTFDKELPGLACCQGCQRKQAIAPMADVAIRLPAGRSFNGSIASFQGKTYLAYRRFWDRARIVVVELGADFQPVGEGVQLPLGRLPQDRSAQEDPRLWVHRDQLFVSYSGCAWNTHTQDLRVSICVAALDRELRVEQTWYPHLPERQSWEKNWAFFEHEGDLYAVYSILPHRVLLVMLNNHRGWMPESLTQNVPLPHLHFGPLEGFGPLRGGAPPLLHGSEYWSFFHGFHAQTGFYSLGLYTFDREPPFRPRRFCRWPLLRPDPSRKHDPHAANVVFPGGAIFRHGVWHIAYGYLDHEVRVCSWRHADLERLLEPLP